MSLLKKRIHYGSERAASSKLSLLLNAVEAKKIINVTYIWQRLSLTNYFDWTLCEEGGHKGEKQTKKWFYKKRK